MRGVRTERKRGGVCEVCELQPLSFDHFSDPCTCSLRPKGDELGMDYGLNSGGEGKQENGDLEVGKGGRGAEARQHGPTLFPFRESFRRRRHDGVTWRGPTRRGARANFTTNCWNCRLVSGDPWRPAAAVPPTVKGCPVRPVGPASRAKLATAAKARPARHEPRDTRPPRPRVNRRHGR